MRQRAQGRGLDLALVHLPVRLRAALRAFHRITGLKAVISVAAAVPGAGRPPRLSPPIHPGCVRRLRSARSKPCAQQWLMHLRAGRRSSRVVSHLCPVGLQCSLVPIHLDGRLVGVAKLVCDRRTSEPEFIKATQILKLAVAARCQDSLVTALAEEVASLRDRLRSLHLLRIEEGQPGSALLHGDDLVQGGGREPAGGGMLEQAIRFLQDHSHDAALTLSAVAGAVGCNPRYLTTRFTQVLGVHMRSYLTGLRVSHACRMLIGSDQPVKAISVASGFPGPAALSRAFRHRVGISPGEYRRIFAEA